MLKVKLPKNVKINWGLDFIKVEGPLGVVIKKKDAFFLAVKEDELYLWTQNEFEENFYLTMINNLILGVTKGYRQRLKLVGVGFKAAIKDRIISLKIGFSHEITYAIPADINIVVSKAKGTFLLIKGKEKDRVQQIATEIRSLRMPDAYKGKGIHFNKQALKLKKGKREGK